MDTSTLSVKASATIDTAKVKVQLRNRYFVYNGIALVDRRSLSFYFIDEGARLRAVP